MYSTFMSRLILTAATLTLLPAAQAAAVSLSNDFSITNGNPNGQWSYRVDSTGLALQTPTANGNTLIPALSTGFWGAGPDINSGSSLPFLFKALVDASSAGGNTTLDFQAGEIVVHTPNANGSFFYATWTAPTAGTVSTLAGSVWYAHSIVTRSSDFQLLHNAAILASGTVTPTQNRTNASMLSVASFAVNSGDTIALALSKTSGQSFGSLAGLSLNMDFTPDQASVPEPSSLMLLGGGITAFLTWRRRG